MRRTGRATAAILAILIAGLAGGAVADDGHGSVTQLPIPRFVSLKADEANVRRGPSLSHRIDWVFKRRAMPLVVTDEFGHWRRVQDLEGAGGWIHYSLLSGARTVIVQEDMTALRMKPNDRAPVNAHAEAGVIARLGECGPDWCRVRTQGQRGWVQKVALWGVLPEEIRE